ncbi:MAG: phosphonate C-P lyase system protein PhnH [Alphaproteobacteria bacterium]|nr:phosphonate C-P lyase system protein PhnH [Alphaproteobacteria bacterium]
MAVTELTPGFSNPVHDSANAFRAILDAMARPGRIVDLPALPEPPKGFDAAAAVLALSLLDDDTPVWIDPGLRNAALDAYLRFHAGCPIVERTDRCRFAFVAVEAFAELVEDLPIGDPDYPDRSATAIVLCDGLTGGVRRALRGPGIQDVAHLAPKGMTGEGWESLTRNQVLFPLGIDTIFVSKGQIAALPRSIRISAEEN